MGHVMTAVRRSMGSALTWFDSWAKASGKSKGKSTGVSFARVVPFLLLHGGALAVIWVGWSWVAVAVAASLYLARMFFITAFYHRYFSHRTFKTSRPMQFGLAILGNTCAQRGPLWWAAHHRHHHSSSDQEGDPHSPRLYNLFYSHMGWITVRENFPTDLRMVPDLASYPELRWLDRFDTIVPIALAAGLFALGAWLERVAPGLGTTGPQMLVWGFFVSTVVLFHASVMINSLAHKFGRRRYETTDDSRNSFLLALVTMGEGWHNNHHRYPNSARQGFFWWEIDVTFYLLKLLSWSGLIWDLRPVPDRVLAEANGRV